MSHGLVRSAAVPTKTRRTIFFVLIVGSAAGVSAVAIAIWRQRAVGPATAERPLELVVSADTAGFIIPCGCTSNQSGGLPRRATYVKSRQQTADVLVLDAGGAPGGASEYDRAKFAAILRGELQMGLAAHNIGRSEALLGADALRQLAADLEAPLISANLSDAAGQPLAPPSVVLPCGDRKLAVIGVISPTLTPPALRASDPREAVLRAIEQAKAEHGRLSAVIVLAYLPPEQLSRLAEGLPEADVIVGGPTGQSIAPRQVGPTLLAAATNKGKFIVHLKAPPAGSSQWSGEVVELTGEYSDHPDQTANLRDFYAVLAERDFTALDTAFVASRAAALPAGYRVAGTPACQHCHAQDHEAWHNSRHAGAWQTLTARGAHVDSYCQQCHATGFGLPGGFASAKRSAAQVNVGCESCHGPSQAHAQRPAAPTAFAGQAKNQCAACHDRENSPKFAPDAYWERIAHGMAAEATQATTDSRK